jgi:hypothetical protein
MGQDRHDPGGNFVARLLGEAAQYSFVVTCSSCQQVTNYEDKILAYPFVRALVDPAIQEIVLTQAADDKELTLKEVMLIVEAQEMGKRSHGRLTGGAGLNRVSEYKAGKGWGGTQHGREGATVVKKQLPAKRGPPAKQGQAGQAGAKCTFCGSQGHGCGSAIPQGCLYSTKDLEDHYGCVEWLAFLPYRREGQTHNYVPDSMGTLPLQNNLTRLLSCWGWLLPQV